MIVLTVNFSFMSLYLLRHTYFVHSLPAESLGVISQVISLLNREGASVSIHFSYAK